MTLKKSLDRLLGGATMYRLVAIILTVLTGVAVVLSLVGVVFYSPLEILGSAVVLIATTMLTSWIFGLLFRRPAHLESAAITGYILLFVLEPSLELPDLLGLAAAGAIASASKFILAIRGRHIFNPAAIAALIVTVAGLQYAIWWVSTPGLLPFVAVGA